MTAGLRHSKNNIVFGGRPRSTSPTPRTAEGADKESVSAKLGINGSELTELRASGAVGGWRSRRTGTPKRARGRHGRRGQLRRTPRVRVSVRLRDQTAVKTICLAAATHRVDCRGTAGDWRHAAGTVAWPAFVAADTSNRPWPGSAGGPRSDPRRNQVVECGPRPGIRRSLHLAGRACLAVVEIDGAMGKSKTIGCQGRGRKPTTIPAQRSGPTSG